MPFIRQQRRKQAVSTSALLLSGNNVFPKLPIVVSLETAMIRSSQNMDRKNSIDVGRHHLTENSQRATRKAALHKKQPSFKNLKELNGQKAVIVTCCGSMKRFGFLDKTSTFCSKLVELL